MTWIDGQQYLTFHFNPELAFGNVGIGLDLNLEFDQDGNLRTENPRARQAEGAARCAAPG